jgi:adenine-specific DNA-methyltransferase
LENNIKTIENKKILNQYFTKNEDLQKIVKMFSLNIEGNILEPSCGEGDLLNCFNDNLERKKICIEIDKELIQKNINKEDILLKECFFSTIFNNIQELKKEIDNVTTIISNPPYVSWNKLLKENKNMISKELLYSKELNKMNSNGNLVYLFLMECAKLLKIGGELIFLIPKDFTVSTSATFVRKYLKENGSITHFFDGMENNFFKDASLENMCIFRWEKGKESNYSYIYNGINSFKNEEKIEKRKEYYSGKDDILFFLTNEFENKFKIINNNKLNNVLGEYFDIKVGSVSGLDSVFKLNINKDNEKYINLNSKNIKYLYTKKDKKEPYLFVDKNSILTNGEKEYLIKYIEQLKKRHGILSDLSNVFCWATVRNKEVSIENTNKRKILIQMKTRDLNPFFLTEDGFGYSGGLFALIPKIEMSKEKMEEITKLLNSNLYKDVFSSNGMATKTEKGGFKMKVIPNSLLNLPFLY